jgi:hypothetical protein
MPINIDDSINPIADGTPRGLIKTINGLANAIKNISGKSSWKDAPDITIQQVVDSGINSNWLIKSANYTASHGDKIICDARSGSFTITLPSNLSPGQFVSIVGIGATVVNPIFLDLQGININGETAGSVLLEKTAIITTLAYFNETIGWIADTTISIGSDYSGLVLQSNPWGYWRLRESADVVAFDSSPNTRNGNYNGGVLLSSIGEPATFNGVDSYVTIPYQVTAPQAFTVECRFKTTFTHGTIFIFSDAVGIDGQATDRGLYLDNGRLLLYVYTTSPQTIITPSTVNDGNWHTVTATLGSRGVEIWLDGVLSADEESITSAYDYVGYWHIGYGLISGFFDGQIGDLSINHSQLSASEIQQRHASFL